MVNWMPLVQERSTSD